MGLFYFKNPWFLIPNDEFWDQSNLNSIYQLFSDLNTNHHVNIFSDFDTETQKSKQEADEALKTIGEIEQIIEDTIRKTQEAQENLTDAADNANSALEKVLQADVLAKNTSEAVDKIAREAEILKNNATVLNNEATDMNYRVQETEIKLNKFFEWTKTNDSLINAAKEAVSRIIFSVLLLFIKDFFYLVITFLIFLKIDLFILTFRNNRRILYRFLKKLLP